LQGWLLPRDDSGAELDAALAGAWEGGVAAAGKVLDLDAGKAALLAVCGQPPDAGTAGSAPPVLPGRALDADRQRPRRRRAQALAAAGARAAVASARSGEDQRGPARRRRRRVVMAAAAAVVLVAGGTWYGLTAGLGGAGRPAGAVNELTAVKGCPGLAATSGTLERVPGTRLVLKTPGGEPVTVTTSAQTTISRQVAGRVSDITDGASVIVFGAGSRGGIAARRIMIGMPPGLSSGPAPARDRQGHAPGRPRQRRSAAPGDGAVGRVTDASAGRFTVVMPGGFRVRVTTSGSTTVYAQAAATVGQFRAGGFVVAVGSVKAGGALAAATVEQGAGLPRIQHGNGIVRRPWLGCSPSAVAAAALLAAG
jgi:hypothetical protein